MIDVMVSLFMRCPMMPHPSSALNMGMAREGSCLLSCFSNKQLLQCFKNGCLALDLSFKFARRLKLRRTFVSARYAAHTIPVERLLSFRPAVWVGPHCFGVPRLVHQQAPVVPEDGKPRALLPECLG